MAEHFTTMTDLGMSIAKTIKEARKLTSGEKDMCKLIFKDTINYETVWIYNNKFITRAFGIYGTLSYPKCSSKNDYSIADLRSKRVFIHEMTHIWQYQKGYSVITSGAIMQFFYLNTTLNPYRYDIGHKFNEYNMESQAEILSHYYVLQYIGGEKGTIALGFNRDNPLASDSSFMYLYSAEEGSERRKLLYLVAESFIKSKQDESMLPQSAVTLNNPVGLGHIRMED